MWGCLFWWACPHGDEGRAWLGVVCRDVFYGVYFGCSPIYSTFNLYSLNQRSLFVLSRDLSFF